MKLIHQLLAAVKGLKNQAQAYRTQLVSTTFGSKRHLFEKKIVTANWLEEGLPPEIKTEGTENPVTIQKELDDAKGYFIKYINASDEVCEGNAVARVDVTLEDETTPILTGVTATSLLELEKRVAELREVLSAIPVFDTSKGFEPDQTTGLYKAVPVVGVRSKKEDKVITLAPATDKHAAQVQLKTYDVPAANTVTNEWSGLISTNQKSKMLAQADKVGRAITDALSRANATDVTKKSNVGDVLVNLVFSIPDLTSK